MKKLHYFFVVLTLVVLFIKCNSPSSELIDSYESVSESSEILSSNPSHVVDTIPKPLGSGYDFIGNGKNESREKVSNHLASDLDKFSLPEIPFELLEGLNHQLKILKHAKVNNVEFGGKELSSEDLKQVINAFLSKQNQEYPKFENLVAYQLAGEDQRGNVHYTGYFTPILKVKKEKDSIFQFPIYRYPVNWKGRMPSRKAIEEDEVLKGRDLEIAYANDQLSIYIMQVQGSGIIEYEDGQQKLLAFAGGNQHSYKSIGRYMIDNGYLSKKGVSLERIKKYFDENPEHLNEVLNYNQSYVFFSPQESQPIGAGNVPLTPNHSIAVDRDHIPLGAILLASIPQVDENNDVSHYEWKFVMAQDVGAAIKGPGHVDLYMGIGSDAKDKASNLHHYGELWIILPK